MGHEVSCLFVAEKAIFFDSHPAEKCRQCDGSEGETSPVLVTPVLGKGWAHAVSQE